MGERGELLVILVMKEECTEGIGAGLEVERGEKWEREAKRFERRGLNLSLSKWRAKVAGGGRGACSPARRSESRIALKPVMER